MRSVVMLLAVVALAPSACHERTDRTIGDPCADDRDCRTACYPDSNEFPDGFCSRPCNSDADCPSDSACVDAAGGMCLFVCPEFNCDYLGSSWHCADRSRRGEPGSITVCIGR
jgi:hypothetical protein